MGAHKHNPLAEGYVGGAPPEALPPLVVGCQLVCQTQPTAEWMKANPVDPETGKRPPCPPEHGEVVFAIVGRLLVPSVLVKKEDYRYCEAPVAEVLRMPFQHFMSVVLDANPGFLESAKSMAPQILLPAGN